MFTLWDTKRNQQLYQYIKDYGIIAKPLHNITKKGAKGPPPCIKGSDYDLDFIKLKAIISDTKLYLHHKDKLRRLFLEVDASDVGWGACAYQMLLAFEGDPKDEGRMNIGDTGLRQIIQWINQQRLDRTRIDSPSVLQGIVSTNFVFRKI